MIDHLMKKGMRGLRRSRIGGTSVGPKVDTDRV